MKKHATIALLIVLLTACTPTADIPINVQNTAMSIVQTDIARTQTALPTPTVISTTTPEATLIPTLSPSLILTPDAGQVERWQEYQTELARITFPQDSPEWFLCEWAILGNSGRKLYVWAVCGVDVRMGSGPVVITINADGSIQNVEKPRNWAVASIHEMFPEDVRNKFKYMEAEETQKMLDHLEWRWAHIGEPPLIILSATPSGSPIP